MRTGVINHVIYGVKVRRKVGLSKRSGVTGGLGVRIKAFNLLANV